MLDVPADLEQQVAQGRPLFAAEGFEDLVLQLAENRAKLRQPTPAGGGEAHDVAAAIIRIAAALYEALLLQVVEHTDELAAVEPEGVGDGRLSVPRALVE